MMELDRALTEQEKEDAGFVALIVDEKTSPSVINRLIADKIVEIRRAQVVQNHNSTVLAKEQSRIAQNLQKIVYAQVGIAVVVVINFFGLSPDKAANWVETFVKTLLLVK